MKFGARDHATAPERPRHPILRKYDAKMPSRRLQDGKMMINRPKMALKGPNGPILAIFRPNFPRPSLSDRKMKKSGPTRRSTLRATSGATVNADVG